MLHCHIFSPKPSMISTRSLSVTGFDPFVKKIFTIYCYLYYFMLHLISLLRKISDLIFVFKDVCLNVSLVSSSYRPAEGAHQ